MSSMNHVVHQLQELGLSAELSGETVFCEDIDLDFERSHDGVRGISRWLVETREEYLMAIEDLLTDPEEPKEESVTEQVEKAQDEAEEFAPAPPEKEHVIDSAQLALAKELNMSPKEVVQATKVDDQDRGGIPSPETYITELKQELPAVVVLVKGQRFLAPEGWKIRESRPSGQVLHYGSIFKGRKLNNQATGSQFSLVRI